MRLQRGLMVGVWGAGLALVMMVAGAQEESGDDKGWDVTNPPGPWKTIQIDTDETTWSDVDVSPDGKTIVFDSLGDIFTVGIDGGDAKPILTGIEWTMQPKFSPDGSQIAFISDAGGGDNVWVANADGSNARALTEEKGNLFHNPAWSPDGNWVAARKGFISTRSIPSGAIWMVRVDGGSGLEVVERPHGEQSQKNIAEPAYSPDGKYLYYSQDTTPGTTWEYNKDPTGQIFQIKRLNLEEGITDVVAGGPGGAIRPTPSPDGKQLAFVKRLPTLESAIFVQDVASGNEQMVVKGLDRDLQETNGSQGNTPAFAWTPDSESLVYWAGGKLRRIALEESEATVIPVRIQVEKQIRETLRNTVPVFEDKFTITMARWAGYTPDRSKVVFAALGKLYVHDVDSGESERLTRQNEHMEYAPSISPDGKSVVYVTWDDQELGAVRTVSIRGGKGRKLTKQPGHFTEVGFSPDGSKIVYRKFPGGYVISPKWSAEPGIYVTDVSGKNHQRVINEGVAPQFSPDAKRIFYSQGQPTGGLTLHSVNLDGKDKRDHLKGAKATSFAISPDANWVAFTEQFNAYLAPLPLVGKSVDVGKSSTAFPVHQLSNRAGEFLTWTPDGKSVQWNSGPSIYHRDVEEVLAEARAKMEDADGADAEEESVEKEESGPVYGEALNLAFTVTADKPNSIIALVGARVITMRDADQFEEVIEDGVILVSENKIAAVGSRDDVEIPADAQQVDVSGSTIIPGLIDVHAHGGMASNEIVPEQNWMQFSNLAFGVTTIHDPSNDTSEIFAHAQMQKAGEVLGPRTFSVGTILYGANFPGYTATVDSLEDAMFHVRRLKDSGAISVKSYNQLRRDSRQQVIEAADQLDMLVFPEGGAKFQHNLTHIVDGHTGIEHSIPLERAYDDVMQLWSQSETWYTPTFGVAYGGLSGETYWYDRTNVWENDRLLKFVPRSLVYPASIRRTTAPDQHYNHFEVAKYAKELRENGVRVQIGAHGQREGLAAHWEIWMMAQGGFTPWQALRGATFDGAKYLGMDQEIGSIEVGKLADLVVIDGNVIDDIRTTENVTHTMINGRLYDANTMQELMSGDFSPQPFYFDLEDGDVFPAAAAEEAASKAERHGWNH